MTKVIFEGLGAYASGLFSFTDALLPKLDEYAFLMQALQQFGSEVACWGGSVEQSGVPMPAAYFHESGVASSCDFDLMNVVLLDVAHELSAVHLVFERKWGMRPSVAVIGFKNLSGFPGDEWIPVSTFPALSLFQFWVHPITIHYPLWC